MPDTVTPPAAPAAPIKPAAPAAPSPKSPVPPAGSPQAHMEAARKVFAPDPSKTPAEPPKDEVKTAPPPTPDQPPKPDTPQTPPVEFPEDKLPEPKSDEAKAGWKELKATTKTLRNEKLALEQQIKELAAKQAAAPAPSATDTAEMERLRAEHKTAMDRLLVVDLGNHPDFHRQYVAPIKKAAEECAVLLADNGVEQKVDFDSLLAKPRAEFAKTVSELASKMNDFDKVTFTTSMRQAYALTAEKAQALAKASEHHQLLQQKSAQLQRQAFDSVAAEVVPNFKKIEVTATMTPEERQGAEAYNQSVESLRKSAEGLAFGKLGERDVATLAFKASAMDHVVKHVVPTLEARSKAQAQLISDLTAELTALRGKKGPPAGGPDASAEAAPAGESIEAAAKRVWNRR